MRLYRENLALKVQLDALVTEVTRVGGKKARVSLRTRAAQVWAYLVTRGNSPFQTHNLSSSPRSIQRCATRLRQGLWPRSEPKTQPGRPPTGERVVALVLALKRENMHRGHKKIYEANCEEPVGGEPECGPLRPGRPKRAPVLGRKPAQVLERGGP
jgi:hypothetical protein